MGDRVQEIAEGALKVLGETRSAVSARKSETSFPDPQRSQIVDALFSGKKVLVSVKDLNCPKIEELRRDLGSFVSSVPGLAFELACEQEKGPAPAKTASPSSSKVSPEKQVLREILADVISHEGGACVVEPGKTCVGCNGHCTTLGF